MPNERPELTPPFALPDELFDGQRWKGRQDEPRLEWFTIQPSVQHHDCWDIAALLQGWSTYPHKPATRFGVSFIFGHWGLVPELVTWTATATVAVANRRPPTIDRKTPPSVYFAITEGAPFVKIGWAKDPDKRRAELQTGCPFTLTMAATVPGSVSEEFAFHRRFAEYRVRPDGEWFHYRGALAAFIDGLATGGANS